MQPSLGNSPKPHRTVALADSEARRVALNQNAADTLGARRRAHPAIHEVQPRDARPRDPPLLTVERPPFGSLVGAGHQIGGGRARLGLRDGDGRLVPFEHPGQVPTLLRLGAIRDERADRPDIALDDDPGRDAADPGDLLDDQEHVEERASCSAVLPGNGEPHEAGRHQILHVVPGIFLVGVPACGALAKHPVGQCAGARLERLLRSIELEVHQMWIAWPRAASVASSAASESVGCA